MNNWVVLLDVLAKELQMLLTVKFLADLRVISVGVVNRAALERVLLANKEIASVGFADSNAPNRELEQTIISEQLETTEEV